MEAPRKIVLILGNGFDLDLGLKTSYKDFWYSRFCPRTYPAPLIYHLNQRWNDNLDAVRWYDIENELLKYYQGLPDPHQGADILSNEELSFLQEFKPTSNLYRRYTGEELSLLFRLINKGILYYTDDSGYAVDNRFGNDCLETPIWRDHKALTIIRALLCDYLKEALNNMYIQPSTALTLLKLFDVIHKDNAIDIYSFNYTPLPLEFGQKFRNYVHYVHGSCKEDNLIIGIGDDGELTKEYDFLRKSFAPEYNPPGLASALLDADDVIIFGHSIGENDRQYFKAFFKQQSDYSNTRKKRITIFTRDSESTLEIKRALHKMTDNNFSALYSNNNCFKIIETVDLKNNSKPLSEFLSQYIPDDQQIESIISDYLTA